MNKMMNKNTHDKILPKKEGNAREARRNDLSRIKEEPYKLAAI